MIGNQSQSATRHKTGRKSKTTSVSPDGSRLVTGGNYELRLWGASTLSEGGALLDRTDRWTTSVAFSPDNESVLTGDLDGTLRVWSFDSGNMVRELPGAHASGIWSAEFSLDGSRILSVGRDEFRIWEVSSGALVGEFNSRGPVGAVAISSDSGEVSSGGMDGSVAFWGTLPDFPQRAEELSDHPLIEVNAYRKVGAAAFSSDDDEVFFAGAYGGFYLWNLDKGSIVLGLPGTFNWNVFSFSLNAWNRFSVFGRARSVYLVNPIDDPWTETTEVYSTQGIVNTLAISPSGTQFASGSSTGEVRIQLMDQESAAPDVLEYLIPPPPGVDPDRWGGVEGLAFDPTRPVLFAGLSDGRVFVLSTNRHDPPVLHPVRLDEGVSAIAVAPDGESIVVGGDWGEIRAFRFGTSDSIALETGGQRQRIYSLAFSGDGSRLASVNSGGFVHFWDTVTYSSIGSPVRAHDGAAFTVGFSNDGQHFVTGGDESVVRLWANFPPGNILQVACRYLPHINGRPDTSTDGLAAEIGIEGLTLPEDCDTYDPPLPPEFR